MANFGKKNGLKGIHFVGVKQNFDVSKKNVNNALKKISSPAEEYEKVLAAGFDAVNSRGNDRAETFAISPLKWLKRYISIRIFKRFSILRISQKEINKWIYVQEDKWENVYPTLLPNWDRSARSGKKARIYTDSTPNEFKKQLINAIELVQNKQQEHKILFLMSWNEWAEGNYVEPDLRYGHGFLDVMKECLEDEN